MSRQVLPQAPSPTMTSLRRISAMVSVGEQQVSKLVPKPISVQFYGVKSNRCLHGDADKDRATTQPYLKLLPWTYDGSWHTYEAQGLACKKVERCCVTLKAHKAKPQSRAKERLVQGRLVEGMKK